VRCTVCLDNFAKLSLASSTRTELTGITLSDAQWEQASRGLWCRGLGLRSAQRHADAAYIASRCATRRQSAEVDHSFIRDAATVGSALSTSFASMDTQRRTADHLSPNSTQTSQCLGRLARETHHDALNAANRLDFLSKMPPGAPIPSWKRFRASSQA